MSDNVRAHQERESIMTKTSRFNYIKRGLVGVCAATMLTGLCAGSAFGTDGNVDASGNGTTAVTATISTQLSATVPTTLTATVNDDGSLQYASNAVIQNKSQLSPIHVTGIAANDKNGKLVAESAFAAAADNNVAWTSVTPGGVTAAKTDLKSTFTTSASWNVPIATGTDASNYGTLTLSFDGKMKNPGTTGDINIYDIVWTLGFGASA